MDKKKETNWETVGVIVLLVVIFSGAQCTSQETRKDDRIRAEENGVWPGDPGIGYDELAPNEYPDYDWRAEKYDQEND